MNILLMLIPVSLLLLLAAILAFVWALRGGQFEDLDTPALDILARDPMADQNQKLADQNQKLADQNQKLADPKRPP